MRHNAKANNPDNGCKPECAAALDTGAGILALTKFGPQRTLICCAALIYVLETGWLLLAAAALNTAIVSCRHLSHVGWLPPGKLMFKPIRYT